MARTKPSRLEFYFLHFVFLFLCGCSSFTFFRSHPSGETTTFQGTYEQVWEATIKTLADEDIPILKVDQAQGLIETKTFPLFRREYRQWAHRPFFAPSGYCMLKIELRQQTENKTQANLQAFFRRKHGLHFFGISKQDKSRGVFEWRLAGRISDHLIKLRYPRLESTIVGCRFKLNEETERYMIVDVHEGSLGYEQGLRNGDVVIRINGMEVQPRNFFDFFLRVEGEEIKTFTVERRKHTLDIPVSVFHLDAAPTLGMRVQYREKNGQFEIIKVTAGSKAAKAGFQIGDVLIEENGIKIDGWVSYYRAILSEKKNQKLTFVVRRKSLQTPVTIEVM
ncbi:MAG: hypothetical protein COV74_08490 [Candidatus Omnitrophica bacterium CG11_big_fil_rev_8_21_14_0_20_45_26]|uniref:PDZ domain-containing protein n=1 Tax=Candidatus Abzuiibacterium crystallinum TaxID=1974748 RepID=A0A2H0LM85_9BACT|nr:MAG: hypothetical protein COV74_08490 [Candidatus Omnitrophica bacterium CG11_big_fil_rev_8_21_14_0_20_45_26]PIW63699.1 MAG: hypothetical protein COW12_09375 [Candidatus Omnitrophica bacterium CG12_big_fil_rev_8_21_14_0_65_45_16]